MLSQPITTKSISRQLENLSPDSLLEVAQFIEFLQFREQPMVKASKSGARVAFGIWADYPEAQDAAAFALKLRQNIEKRLDG
jgi:hypothetical protein